MEGNEQAMADAAAAVTATLFGAPASPAAVVEREESPVEATTDEVVEQPAADAVEAVEAAPVATFDLNPKIPEDLAAELAEADIDAEVEAEVAAYVPPQDEWGNDVDVDTDAVREKIKLQKRVEFLEKQVVEAKSSAWKKEAEQFFPLSKHSLDTIQAGSRRAFLRAAKAEHDRILPIVQSYLAEAKEVVEAERSAATTEARAEVAEAWGKPAAGPDSGLTDTAAHEARLKTARSKGRLADVFAEMMRGPK